MNLFYVLLSCAGLTYILKYGSLLKWPRDLLCKVPFFAELFKCSLCLGFWSGIIIAAVCYFIEWESQFFLLPLASSALSWFLDSALGLIQAQELLVDKCIEDKNKD